MKKVLAVLVAVVLAFSLSVTSFAAETKSGEISAAFADFDPSTITDMLSGVDLGSITGSLGSMDLGAITGLFEGVNLDSITDMFGDLNLGGLTDILGGLDISGLLGGLGGNKDDNKGDDPTVSPTDKDNTTKAPDATTAAPTTAAPTTSPSNNGGNIPQTGSSDNGMISAFAICAIAAGAFIVLSKKKEA